MKKTASARRIAEACQAIVQRSDEIATRAGEPGAGLSRIFSRKEIGVTNGICCEFMLAVAESESIDDLVANRANFKEMRHHVMVANESVAKHTTANPQTMSSIANAEDTLFNLLVAGDPTVRLMAGFAKKHLGIIKSMLTAFFTDIRLLFDADAGKGSRTSRLVRAALSAPVGSLFLLREDGLLERYGDARVTRQQVVAFLQRTYRESDLKTRSWTKVVKWVRASNDGRCKEICKMVAGFAKPGENGLEKAWNSVRQQAKILDEALQDEKKRKKF